MATYASTGAAGDNVEIDYAALLAVCFIAESPDRALPPGVWPFRLSLQRRDGPAGYDDIVVEWVAAGPRFLSCYSPWALNPLILNGFNAFGSLPNCCFRSEQGQLVGIFACPSSSLP